MSGRGKFPFLSHSHHQLSCGSFLSAPFSAWAKSFREVIRQDGVINEKCDVWSFGVVRNGLHETHLFANLHARLSLTALGFDNTIQICWELMTSLVPYEGFEPFSVMLLVGRQSKTPPIPEHCPDLFASLLGA